MSVRDPQWDSEILFTSGDEYFAGLLRAIEGAQTSVELETYIFEKGVIADRMVAALVCAAARGLRVRVIVDGWGSPGFAWDYLPHLKQSGVHVRFFRVIPFILRRLPGDPQNPFRRIFNRFTKMNRGLHRKFCLIDGVELWVGSFNVSDVHVREVHGDEAWKDVGVCVRGKELRYARRTFHRTFRGWSAFNLSTRSPRLLLLNDSFLHKRRTRLETVDRLKSASQRIWLATPYFVPVGQVFRLLSKRAKGGLDVRLVIPSKNDVFFMKWISVPLLRSLAEKGVKIFIFEPRFSHQKVFIADEWMCIGSTNLNHRSFLHDLEMDVVITKPENKARLIENYLKDLELSRPFDDTNWAHPPLWKRVLSSVFILAKYWS